jgi:hypothetical protein
VARDGTLHTLGRPEELINELHPAFHDQPKARAWWRGRLGLDAALALTSAVVLWMVIVPGSDVSEATVPAAIEVMNLPRELELESVEPASVEVTLSGLRRDILLAEGGAVSIRVDAYLTRLGRRTFAISEQNVQKPDSLEVVSLRADKVRLVLKATDEPPKQP